MFDLEQAISERRRQMLAAGIQTPAPLEELEIHLREELEQLIKSGSNEAEAFQVAVNKIGQAHLLQNEFKKVKKGHKVIRAILLILGWLAASCTLVFSILLWDLDWNLFSFSPRWNLSFIWTMLGILVSEASILFLSKALGDKASRSISLLVCLLLAALAVLGLIQDQHAHYIFGTPRVVPLWYQGAQAFLLCLPGAFWTFWTQRHLAQKRRSPNATQPICSD